MKNMKIKVVNEWAEGIFVIFVGLPFVSIGIIFGIIEWIEYGITVKFLAMPFCFLLGLVAFIYGGSLLKKIIKIKKTRSRLVKQGEYIEATMIGVTEKNNHYELGEGGTGYFVTYYILCSWENPITKEKYTFKSQEIKRNPSEVLLEKGIKTIPVYLDKSDPSKYYVALEYINNK